jgi:thioredoxin-dependent peroxiredoxin
MKMQARRRERHYTPDSRQHRLKHRQRIGSGKFFPFVPKPEDRDQRKAEMNKLCEGDIAPDFELPEDGGSIELAAFRGRIAVVYFYPKDDTKGCTVEAIDFSRLHDRFAALGATTIGISPDSVRKHRRFSQKHELTIRLAADEDHAVAEAYGVWGEKTLYGRTYMGIVRSTFLVAPDGKIAQVWRNVRVNDHAEAVLRAVEVLAKS